MLHEHIKNTALRMQSADNVLFGESKKAHPLGVGGLAISLAEDRVLMQLNSDYNDSTNITLYTEHVVKSINSFLDTVSSATSVGKLYRESKLKIMLSKVWAWFKKVAAYIANISKRIYDFIRRKFGKNKDVNKSKPSNATAEIKKAFLIGFNEESLKREMEAAKKTKDAEAIARLVENGISAGIESISSKSKNSIRYASPELKKMASLVTATLLHGGYKPSAEGAAFDRQFYDTVKGTEFEIPFLTSAIVMAIVASEEIPYMPSKVEEYMVSIGVKKSFFSESIFETLRTRPSDDGIVDNLARALSEVHGRISDIMPVVASTEWGASLMDVPMDVISLPDDMLAAASKIHEQMELMGDISAYTNANIVDNMKSHSAKLKSLTKVLLPVFDTPEKFIASIKLKDVPSAGETFKDHSGMFDILATHADMKDLSNPETLNAMVQEGMEFNRNITEDTMLRSFNVLIDAMADIPKIANGVSKILTKMLSSAYAVEEDLTGFFGTIHNMDNVPLTALAATVAHDTKLREIALKSLGYI